MIIYNHPGDDDVVAVAFHMIIECSLLNIECSIYRKAGYETRQKGINRLKKHRIYA